MSVDNFIPEIWAARLLASLKKSQVFAQANVVNRDYEGDISQKGDTVRIGGIGAITVKPFTKNTDIDAPEVLSDDMTSLLIDQADYFNFLVDDVDRRQAAVNLLDGAMTEAAYSMSDAGDQFLAGIMASDGTPFVPDETDLSQAGAAYEALVDGGTALSEANVVKASRFVVVPPWYFGLLLKDDRFVKFEAGAADRILFNAQIGQAAGFAVLESNNVPGTSSSSTIIAGHPSATSYAEQISKTEAFRPERRFADAVKGLHLYGGKVIRPTALAVWEATRP